MPPTRFSRFLPLAGIPAAVLFAAALGLTLTEPDVTDGLPEYVRHYADHAGREVAAAILLGYVAVLLPFFAAGLRGALRSGEAGEFNLLGGRPRRRRRARRLRRRFGRRDPQHRAGRRRRA